MWVIRETKGETGIMRDTCPAFQRATQVFGMNNIRSFLDYTVIIWGCKIFKSREIRIFNYSILIFETKNCNSYFFKCFTFTYYLFVCEGACEPQNMHGGQRMTSKESVLSFSTCGSRKITQVISLGSRYLYLLSHLSSPENHPPILKILEIFFILDSLCVFNKDRWELSLDLMVKQL